MTSRRPMRDCWLAVNLSGLLPGAGQCYANQWTKGLIVASVFLSLVAYSLWSLLAAQGSTIRALWAMAIAVIVYLLNLWDAFATAGRPVFPAGYKHRGRDIWYSVFLSQVLPGLGHLYLNRAIAGGIFLVAGVGLSMLANYRPVLLPMACTVWSIASYHAYRVAPRTPGKNFSCSGYMLMVVVLGSLLLRLCVGSLPLWVDNAVLQTFVPSESMLPTLQAGDRLFVSRSQPYYPQTGDVVVFTPPRAALTTDTNADDLFVKRIVATPGQRVEVKQGQVWVNQQPLLETYMREPMAYTWGPGIVPSDSYFVLGDNRNASADSHLWGFLPKDHIVGPAYKIYWPPSRVQSLER